MYGTLGVIHMDYKMLKYARLLVHMPLINGRRSFHQYIAKSNILEMSTWHAFSYFQRIQVNLRVVLYL